MESDKVFISDFIEIYRKHPALWNIKSSLNKNKALRDAGISELLEKCKEKYPEANKDFVRKKINNLRSAFRRELSKVKNSKRTGSSPDDIYMPTLWYYDLLYFTAEDESGRRGIDSLDDDNEGDEKSPNSYQNVEEVDQQISSPKESTALDVNVSSFRSKRLKTFQEKKREFIDLAHETMKTLAVEPGSEDECSIIGKRFALQLKAMDEEQRLLAEKLINDIMYYGRKGKLEESHIGLQAQILSTPKH